MYIVFASSHVPRDWLHRSLPGTVEVRSVPGIYNEISHKDILACRDVEKIVAVGSGRVIDYVKLLSYSTKKLMVAVPTSITTDCIFTNTTALRLDGSLKYVTSKVPDEISLIPELMLGNNIKRCNYAWLDLLSAFTSTIGIEDIISEQQYNYNLKLKIYTKKRMINIKNFSDILHLLSCIQYEVDLCEKANTAFGIEEGLEHYLSYLLEDELDKRYMHGEYLHATMTYLVEKHNIYIEFPDFNRTLNMDCIRPILEKIEPAALEWLRRDVKEDQK